jgi:hypothetical protein
MSSHLGIFSATEAKIGLNSNSWSARGDGLLAGKCLLLRSKHRHLVPLEGSLERSRRRPRRRIPPSACLRHVWKILKSLFLTRYRAMGSLIEMKSCWSCSSCWEVCARLFHLWTPSKCGSANMSAKNARHATMASNQGKPSLSIVEARGD